MQIVENVPVSSLSLDRENPRLERAESQRDVIRAMTAHQDDKLIRLAKDIVDYGINQAELPIVIDDQDHRSRYVVLEGNRRIAALKILLSPELVSGILTPATNKRLKKLSVDFRDDPIDNVDCSLAKDRGEAAHWIQLRHTGENSGAGLVGWGAVESARFSRRQGQHSAELDVLEFVEQHGRISDRARQNLPGLAVTNLGRLINDPHVRDALGVEKRQGRILTRLPRNEVAKGLSKIVEDLALKRIDVYDIHKRENRERYIAKLAARHLPNLERCGDELLPLSDAPATGIKKKGKAAKKKTRPTRRKRKSLIRSGCELRIEHDRINDIFVELTTLSVQDHPNAVGVLFRVFIELTVDDFVRRKGLKRKANITENSKLTHKLQVAANHVKEQGWMTPQQLVPVRRAASKQHFLASSITTLHAYVHNPHLSPDPDTLRTAWDNLQTFIEALFNR